MSLIALLLLQIERLYVTDSIIVVTDRTSIELNIGGVKVRKIEENDARKLSGYHLNDNVKFPFGLWNRSE